LGKDFQQGILCPQFSNIPPYQSSQVIKLKEEVATLKKELQSLKEDFENFSPNAVQYSEVPDLQSRLVKVENQAALYGTSWKVLQDSQDLLAEELKSFRSKTFSTKAPWLKKKTRSQ